MDWEEDMLFLKKWGRALDLALEEFSENEPKCEESEENDDKTDSV